jgi:spermidine synthase
VYEAILLDVDNGPEALVHPSNERLYSNAGLAEIRQALRPRGALGVWSFSDDHAFTRRLEQQGFSVEVHRVPASRKGRGRHHFIWVARA